MAESPDPPGLADAVRILAVEESPLWEVLWEVGGHAPRAGEAERIAIAGRAVAALLAAGIVELVWTRWTADGIERRLAAPAECPGILTNPLHWVQGSRYQEYVEIHHAPGRGGRR